MYVSIVDTCMCLHVLCECVCLDTHNARSATTSLQLTPTPTHPPTPLLRNQARRVAGGRSRLRRGARSPLRGDLGQDAVRACRVCVHFTPPCGVWRVACGWLAGWLRLPSWLLTLAHVCATLNENTRVNVDEAFTQVAEAVHARVKSGVIDPMDEVG